MSRWGALFASLSLEDRIDKSDKKLGHASFSPLSVSCVDFVPRETGAAYAPRTSSSAGTALVTHRLAQAIADGAEQEADPDGWLGLVLPDGRRRLVAPHIVAALDAAGLLPDLPPTVPRSASVPAARQPSWSDPKDTPREGERCKCGGRWWWTASPEPDGWCCSTCHPPPPGLAVTTIET